MYRLGRQSLNNLNRVNTNLVKVIKRAIELTEVDFSVIEGLRTVERQQILVESGASRTMRSKHIEGRAVDLAAYVGGGLRWDFGLYYKIALAVQKASSEFDIPVRWGGSWTILDDDPDMEGKVARYVARKHQQHKKAWIDGVHFELV